MPFVPSCPAEETDAVADGVLRVFAEAIFDSPLLPVRLDVRRRVDVRAKCGNRLVVAAHVRVVHVHQRAKDDAGARTRFEFKVVCVTPRDVPIHVDAVGHRRHQCFGASQRPVRRHQLNDHGVRVAARVGGVVVRAVVVDGPVGELQMAVAAGRIEVEEIHEPHLSGPDLQSALRQPRHHRQRPALDIHVRALSERDHVTDHQPREVRRRAEVWIAHDVEIREAGDADGIAQSTSARAFHVDEQFSALAQTCARVDGPDARECLLSLRLQAVVAAVGRCERAVDLIDEIDLSREPPGRIGMWRHCLRLHGRRDDKNECDDRVTERRHGLPTIVRRRLRFFQ